MPYGDYMTDQSPTQSPAMVPPEQLMQWLNQPQRRPQQAQPPAGGEPDLAGDFRQQNPGKPLPQATIGVDATGGAVNKSAADWSDLLKQMGEGKAGQQVGSYIQPPQLNQPVQQSGFYGNPNSNSLVPQQGDHLMRIINGNKDGGTVQDTRFSPTADGRGMQAVQNYNPNSGQGFALDPNSGQWFQNTGGAPAPQGMDFFTAQKAVGGYLPNNFGAQLQGIISQLPPAVRNDPHVATSMAMQYLNGQNDNAVKMALGLGDIGVRNRQVDINAEMANAPASLRVQVQKDLDVWNAANPNATPEQRSIALQNAYSQAKMLNSMVGPGGGPQAPQQPEGNAPASAVGSAGQRGMNVGADVMNYIHNSNDAGQAMSAIYRYDQSHPGFMQSKGRDVMAELLAKYGNDGLRGQMNPGVFPLLGERLGMTTNSDLSNARNAFRQYLGYGQPKTNIQRGFGAIGGLMGIR